MRIQTNVIFNVNSRDSPVTASLCCLLLSNSFVVSGLPSLSSSNPGLSLTTASHALFILNFPSLVQYLCRRLGSVDATM